MNDSAFEQREVVDDRYCTEFTTEHGLSSTGDEWFYFAFVCPGCGNVNPLKGNPREFRDTPFRCLRCTRVSFLVGPALDQFAAENGLIEESE